MPRSNQWRRTLYRERIEKLAPGYDPAHVEGFVRLLGSSLESYTPFIFEIAVQSACNSINEFGLEIADRVAEKEGLRPKKRAS